MNDTIAVQMMQRCLQTIEDQRAQIAYLTPKAEAYDRMSTLLDVVRPNGNNQMVGAGEDVAWRLRREIQAAEGRMEAEKHATRPERASDEKPPVEQAQQERSTVEGVGHLHLG